MSRAAAVAIGLGIVLRLALFPFAENKHGDAPMRALVAERMVLDPASAAIPRTYCQFGPLHTTLMRPFIALDSRAPRSSRYLSLLAGIAVLFPFAAFGRRLVGQRGADLATFALALSPLHLQASTTAASEALYLLLWVCALERLLVALEPGDGVARTSRLPTFAVAGLLASLAAVTRYDAWLALPVVALSALIFMTKDRRSLVSGLAVFSLCAASLPVAWLAWGARVGGDPFFFAHYIMTDHAGLAADVVGRFGPLLGRARQLGIWTLSFVAAMTLPGAVAVAIALVRGRRPDSRWSPAMRIIAVAALAPPALYLARGLVLQSFEPLARFALVPGTLLLPLAATVVPFARARQFRVATAAAAVAFSIAVWLVATVGRDRIWAGAESMGAVTRLDAEDRDLARWLRAHRRAHEPVMIEPLAFAEIGVAHAAGVPWTESVTLVVTREPRATVAESMRATGARFVVGYERPGGWPSRLPDWPARDERIGRWRIAAPQVFEPAQ